MSETTRAGRQAHRPCHRRSSRRQRGPAGHAAAADSACFGRQREATILVVTVALLLYFGLTNPTTFVSRTNVVDLLSENTAPIAIIAIGEVFLLICGEIDLSVGFIYTLAPFIMFFANVYSACLPCWRSSSRW